MSSQASAAHILIVEDEPDIAQLLALNLQSAGYQTTIASEGRAALSVVNESKPDLVLLDVMLPGMDGVQIASRLRTEPSTAMIPIIMLTARTTERDQLRGLDSGADDYIVKPFSMNIVLARVAALLRRRDRDDHQTLRSIGHISIDTDRHEVFVDDDMIELTATEYRILVSLMRRPGAVLARDELIRLGIGPGIAVTGRTIDVHMAAIRRKLAHAGQQIHTVRGVGYRIDS